MTLLMGEQLTLVDIGEFVEPERGPAAETLQERFLRFHEANPWVYRAVVTLARDLRQRGQGRIGIGMLFEVLRWQHAMTTEGDEFKLNNSYRSRYARLIAEIEPDLADAFEMRELKAA